ncbi:hypothetical protein ACFFNY_08420 [Paenibacillus hodogayensis]|uniref:Transposase n=1 Tax=Paenibacillus hodogayensis TaxID=279208 RepID=A0ABV5VTK3_9BACL
MELSNLIGVVFLLEQEDTVYSFMKRMEQLTAVLERLPADLFPIFQTWIKLVTKRGLTEEDNRKVSEMIDRFTEPREAEAMISNVEKLFAEFRFKAEQEGLEMGFERGIVKGMEKGIQEGLEKGIQEGLEKGLQEAARRMLGLGMDTSMIVKATGLSEQEIDKLRQQEK